jgi:outer membrane lipoprotein-sorting protein
MKATRILTPLAALGLLATVASGCTAGQQVTAADVVQKMRETMKTTTSVQSTADLSLTINKDGIKALVGSMMPGASAQPGKDWTAQIPDSVSGTLNYWKQSPDKMRVEIADSSIAEAKGATVVYDGQKVYALDAANNTVYTATPSKHMDKIPAEIQAAMSGVDIEKELDKVIAASDIKLTGTEKIAGMDTYKLDVTPKPDATDLLEIPQMYKMQAGLLIKDLHFTIWVDKDRWIPLKFTAEHPNIGTFTYAASKLDVNKPIDAANFVLQVPAGAKTVDVDALAANAANMEPQKLTIDQARDAAQKDGFKLLEPTYVADNATLVDVTQIKNPVKALILSYSSATTDFTVAESRGKMMDMLGDNFSGVNGTGKDAIKQVTVRGVEATAFSPDGANWTALIWQEKDSDLWLAVRGKFSVEEALKIAEGLK